MLITKTYNEFEFWKLRRTLLSKLNSMYEEKSIQKFKINIYLGIKFCFILEEKKCFLRLDKKKCRYDNLVSYKVLLFFKNVMRSSLDQIC